MAKINIQTEEARKELNALIAELKQLKEISSGVVKPATNSIKDFDAELKKLNQTTKSYEDRLKKIEGQLQKGVTTQKRSTKAIQQTASAYEQLKTKAELANRKVKEYASTLGVNAKKTKQASIEAKKLNRQLLLVNETTGKTGGGMLKLGRSIKNALSRFIGFTLISTVIFGLASAIRKAVEQITEFDKTMVGLSAILGVAKKDLKDLNAEILNVASKSVNTSNDVAKLATTLATLGKTKDEIKLLLEPVNDLSIGLDATSEQAGNLLVNTLNAFGKGAESAGKFADIIANMRKSTSLDFQKIVDSISFVSPVAKTVGDDLSSVGAKLGVLVSSGQKAAKAGRLLRTSYLRLAKQGLSVENALNKINEAQEKGIKDTKLLSLAGKLFGTNAAAIGIILANNRDKTEELTKKFREQSGVLKDLVQDKLESISAQVKITNSLWEKWMLSIENGTGRTSKFFKTTLSFMDEAIRRLEVLTTSKEDALNFKKSKAESQGLKDGLALVNTELENYQKLGLNGNKQQIIEGNIKSYGLKYDKLRGKIGQLKHELTLFGEVQIKIGSRGQVLNSKEIKDRDKLIKSIKEDIRLDSIKLALLKGKLKAFRLLNKEENKSKKSKSKKTDTINRDNLLKFSNLKNKIQVQDLLNEIQINKDKISNDKTTYQEKIKLANDNFHKLEQINKLSVEDEIQKIKDKAIKENAINQKKLDDDKINFEEFSVNQKRINKNKNDSIILATIKADNNLIKLEQDLTKNLKSIDKTQLDNLIKLIREKGDAVSEEEIKELKSAEGNSKKIAAIKKKYAKIAIKEQIKLINEFLSNLKLPKDIQESLKSFVAQLNAQLNSISNAKGSRSLLGIDTQKGLDALQGFANQATDILDNIYQGKLNRINDEINAERDKYDELTRLAEDHYNKDGEFVQGNARQKDLIAQEARKKEKILEKEKRKEQIKQAKLSKAQAIIDVIVNTAGALTKNEKEYGFIPSLIFNPIVIALGAAQIATIAAQPIPKYAKGGTMDYDGLAMINDANSQEYVQRDDTILTTTKKNALVNLKQNDIIYKSYDDMRNNVDLINIINQGNSINNKEIDVLFKGIENSIERGFSKAKTNNNINMPSFNLNDELWRLEQSR